MLKKPLKIKIRKMRNEDIDFVMEIEKDAYGENHWSRDSFFSEINNKLADYYCAIDNTNKLVGYIGYWNILEEVHLTTIAVDKNYRNQKIGKLLFNIMIDNCYKKMIKFVTLEVRISNIPAISLYQKYGLNSVGVRKKYYQDNNEDALIMFSDNLFHEKFKSLYNQNKLIETLEVEYE